MYIFGHIFSNIQYGHFLFVGSTTTDDTVESFVDFFSSIDSSLSISTVFIELIISECNENVAFDELDVSLSLQ